MPKHRHPLQPLVTDKHGTVRFQENALVRFLIDWASSRGMDMNALALVPFSQADREQFAQLIGYSVSGFGELPYVTDETYARVETAQRARLKLGAKRAKKTGTSGKDVRTRDGPLLQG